MAQQETKKKWDGMVEITEHTLERRRTEARKDQQIERNEADVTHITWNSEWISLLEMQNFQK